MAQRFRLATLIRVLEDRRDALREELSQADRALDILADQLSDLDRSAIDALDDIREKSLGIVDVDHLMSARRHTFSIRRQRMELLSQIDLVKEERERRRVALMEADREVKKFERMREHWELRVQAEEERVAQTRIDEVSLLAFHRQRSEETER